MYDLHCHSVYSDGVVTPEEICEEAVKKGLTGFALTDHDTFAGCKEAAKQAERHGLDFIPGIEFGVEYKGREVHILAYFIDEEDEDLKDLVRRAQEDRVRRIGKTVRLLREGGFEITMDEVRKKAENNMSRSHIAEILAEKGYTDSIKDSFRKYLGHGRKYHVRKEAVSLEEVAKVLKEGGYLSSIAHPATVGDDDLVREISDLGIRGIEVVNEKLDMEDTRRYIALAKEKDLVITGGSDCHGRVFGNGKYLGNFTVGDRNVERMKEL